MQESKSERKVQVSPKSEEQRTAQLIEQVAGGTASETEADQLAQWLLQMTLYYAHLKRADDPEEVAVITTERLWIAVQEGRLKWNPEHGMPGILSYIQRAVEFTLYSEVRQQSQWAAVNLPYEDSLAHAVDDPTEALTEKIFYEQVVEILRQFKQSLSVQQQLVLELRLEGLLPNEIAEITGIPRTQVNVVLSQAYKRLREMVAQSAQSNPALTELLNTVLIAIGSRPTVMEERMDE